jgi:ribosomal-protein-serine acetyltransferase
VGRPRKGAGRTPAAARRVVLHTERLVLEPVSRAHAEGLLDAVVSSRPELLPWMPWARTPSLEDVLDLAERDEKAWREDLVYQFAVVDGATRQPLGVAGLNREEHDEAELHYWIRTDRAGKGLTTEACRALVEWARDGLRLTRLTLWAGRDNHASRRVAEKLAFVHLGPLEWRPEGGLGDFAAESYELRLPS